MIAKSEEMVKHPESKLSEAYLRRESRGGIRESKDHTRSGS